ncbi:MAG: protein kinase domain-containing protein [Planctomycetota bacterium]|jgi:serine/threonine protein kinase
MGVCLSQELLELYLANSCSEDELREVETHLAECETCRQKVESARQSEVKQDQSPTVSMPAVPSPQPGAHIPTREVDSLFENYQIIKELPRGGQAVVYQATHTPTKTNVAIKVLLPTLLASTRARYYFEREAELIASLDHPNIVKIRDSGIIHGQYYFVMEYIKGQSLNRYVSAQNLSFRERVVLFSKVCAAISYAHQQGIIHRDLKFANILIDKYGEPHILDFGLAKAIGLSEQAGNRAVATITGQWSGSLSNMSPEQAAGRPDLLDVRTDVYSLGVILYHMLTGQYPYDVSGAVLDVLQNIQKAEPIRPRQIIRKFDSDVEAILLSALSKERAERYQSVADLQSDIENWLQGRPIRVRSISTIYLLRKIIARHRYASTVVGLLLLIVLSFSYVSLDLYLTTRKAQQESDVSLKQSSAIESKNLILTRRLTFANFLQIWHSGNNEEAAVIAQFITAGSKEKQAAMFLLNPNLLAEKEADFRQSLSDDNTGFVDFIIGEHHIKTGNLEEALNAYRNSYETIRQLIQSNYPVDTWLEAYVRARLYELNATNKQTEKAPKIKSGD